MGIKKILGIALTAVGAVGTITGTVLLPVGCLSTYTQNIETLGFKGTLKIGVGSSNYNELISWNFSQYGENYNEQQVSDYLDGLKEEIKKAKKEDAEYPSYSDFVKSAKEAIEEVDKLPSGTEKDELLKSDPYLMTKAVLPANNMRIAGAVLLPLFAVIMIIGIVFIVLSKKQKA